MDTFSIPIANEIFHATVLLLIYYCINLWHQKFVTADVSAVFVNKQHGIQRRGQDFVKEIVFKEVHSKDVDTRHTQFHA